MSDVQFNLQDHLRDMEGRIRGDIKDLKREVETNQERLEDIEIDVAAAEARTEEMEKRFRWAWRVITLFATALAGYFGLDIGLEAMP